MRTDQSRPRRPSGSRGNALRRPAGRSLYRADQKRRPGYQAARPQDRLNWPAGAFGHATLFVVAGPNGCGKSTLSRTTWFDRVEVIDPDAIARGLVPGTPDQAAREAVRRRWPAIDAGRTLVVETTIAGHGILHLMEAARTAGYRIELHYVSVDSPDLALDRIRNRTCGGGLSGRWTACRPQLHGPTRPVSTTTPTPTIPTARLRSSQPILRWTAERLPGWVIAAIARIASLRR